MNRKVFVLFDELIKQGLLLPEELHGCNELEMEELEAHFQFRLPGAYREFMSLAGKGAGSLFKGTDIFFPRVLKLQSEAMDLLAELGKSSILSSCAKVFCMHQGYEINYFLSTEDDPPVMQFFEGQESPTNPWRTFSQFLGSGIDSHLQYWGNLHS
ncbi:SMI1/KNR4 family protein [Herbaspirillum camelliae]|uniref:SMI1/KNR4 family protein n=1 Tax=Herbaspirillum camelliae TaxID=1892903 RepID=UPI0009FAB6C7|nr:SMI1/KNR4 family protein [Herbaspirillum camelliae]